MDVKFELFFIYYYYNMDFSFLSQDLTMYVALTDLRLTMQTRLVLDSQRLACFCFLDAGIKGVLHHAQI